MSRRLNTLNSLEKYWPGDTEKDKNLIRGLVNTLSTNNADDDQIKLLCHILYDKFNEIYKDGFKDGQSSFYA